MEGIKEKSKKVGECPECGLPYYAVVYVDEETGEEVGGSLERTECGYCGYGLISGKPANYGKSALV